MGLMAVLACRLIILRLRKARNQGIASCLHMSKGRKRRIRSTNSCCLQLTPMKSLHSRYPTAKWTDQTACSHTGNVLLNHLSVHNSSTCCLTCCFHTTQCLLCSSCNPLHTSTMARQALGCDAVRAQSQLGLSGWTKMGRIVTKLLPNVLLYGSTHRLAGDMCAMLVHTLLLLSACIF